MNVRSLIKLKRFTLTKDAVQHTDNKYNQKVEIWHGDDEHPYHETASFTKEELLLWLANIGLLHDYLLGKLRDEAESRSKNAGDC